MSKATHASFVNQAVLQVEECRSQVVEAERRQQLVIQEASSKIGESRSREEELESKLFAQVQELRARM